jgi:hypothetical protein
MNVNFRKTKEEIISTTDYRNTFRQTRASGSYISDDAHVLLFNLFQSSSIENGGAYSCVGAVG